MVLLYMVTFTINIPPMLAYTPAPWILWDIYIYPLVLERSYGQFIIFLASGRVGTDLAGWNSWRWSKNQQDRWMADQFNCCIYNCIYQRWMSYVYYSIFSNKRWITDICLVVYLPTPLKNDGVKVSWEFQKFPTEFRNIQNVIKKMVQTTKQIYNMTHEHWSASLGMMTSPHLIIFQRMHQGWEEQPPWRSPGKGSFKVAAKAPRFLSHNLISFPWLN